MNSNEITFKVTLALDDQWASNHNGEDIVEFIRHSFNTTLGFRGEIKRLRVVAK